MTTEERILLRARMLFIEKGIAGTQMTEIADIAGINRRTLYRYFPTKDHLVCRMQIIVSAQLNDYLNRLGKRLTTTAGSSQLEEYFRLIDLRKIRDLLYLNAQFDSNFTGPYPEEEMKEKMNKLRSWENNFLFEIIQRGQEDGTIRKDLSSREIFLFLYQSFMALNNRIVLGESHRENPHSSEVDYGILYEKLILENLKR